MLKQWVSTIKSQGEGNLVKVQEGFFVAPEWGRVEYFCICDELNCKYTRTRKCGNVEKINRQKSKKVN